ncbi:MAG: nucleotidyltransferase family protein [Bacteroidales bacterium]
MNLEEIKIILKKQKKSLRKRFKIKKIALFGSYTRGEQTESSDVDIMVEFDAPIGIEFIDLADELEKVLNTKVDLVSRNAMKPRLMKHIEKELIYV